MKGKQPKICAVNSKHHALSRKDGGMLFLKQKKSFELHPVFTF